MKNYSACKLCGSLRISEVLATNDFEILKCQNCKIAFTNPSPMVPNYSDMDFHSGENKEKGEQLTFLKDLHEDWQLLIRKQVTMINDNFDRNATILEIGCGEGILLDELNKLGFHNLQGIEPSKKAASRAKKKNLDVKNIYFVEGVVDEKFDLVMMSHVFEHIEDPFSFLNLIKSVLKPNGGLMLTQTNYKGLLPTFKKEEWYAWVPQQHFWHFTPFSLKKIFRRFNFETRAINYSTLVHPKSNLYHIARTFPFLQDQFIILNKLKK